MRSLLHYYLFFAGFIEQFYQYQTTVVKLEVWLTLDIHNRTASIDIYNDTHAGRQIQTKLLDRFLNGSCILDMKYKPDIRNETVVLKVTRFVDIPCSPSNNSGTDIVTEGLGQIHNALSHLDTNHILKSVINGTFHIFCGAEMINNCADVRKCEKHKQYEHVKCMERGVAGFIGQFYQYQTTVVKLEVLFTLDIHNRTASIDIYNDTHAGRQIQTQLLDRFLNGSCILDMKYKPDIRNETVVLKVTRFVDIPCSPSNNSGTDIVTEGLGQIHNVLNHLDTNHILKFVTNGTFHIFCGAEMINNCADVRKCEKHKQYEHVKCIERGVAGFIGQFYQYQTTVVKLEVLFTLDIHNRTASIDIYNDTHAGRQIQTQLLDRFLNGSCILDMKYKPDIRNETVVLKVTRFVDIPCSPSNNSGTDIVTEGLGQIHNALNHLDTNHILKFVKNGTFHIFCGPEMINNCADVRKCEKHKQYEHVKCMRRGGNTASYSSESVTIGSMVGSHRTDAALSGNTGSYSSESVTIGSMVGTDAALSGNTGSHSSESVTIGSVVGTEQLSGSPSPNREKESDSSKAVTIGAVVGTVAALSGLVAAATFLRRKCKKNASVSDDTSDISSNVSSDLDDKLFFPRMFEINVASGRPPQKTVV